MALKFVTGNKNKFGEVKAILAPLEVEQVDFDLDEIQELDAQKVIEHKLKQAQQHQAGEYIVEDTSLYLECLNGTLPGPFIKWFLQALGNEKLVTMSKQMGNNKGFVKTIIGYISEQGNVQFFEGHINCTIVEPRGDKDFGFGPIVLPEGQEKTFGEMEREEKHALSMRGIAAGKLKEFLVR